MIKIHFPEGTGRFSRLITAALFRFIDFLDINNETITTYRIKKLRLSNNLDRTKSTHRNLETEIGIIIQGQVVSGTTFRICQRYRNLYPNVRIVLSTWETESEIELANIRDLNVSVIVNKVPENSGPGNINLQILSTRAGFEYLRDFSPNYILKNRSDCWLSSDFFLEYLHTLLRTYGAQEPRIIVPSYNSFLFRLYSASDQIQFGEFENLDFFWSCPLVEDETKNFRFPESYLLRNMLEREGVELKYNIEDSLTVYRDRFIFADEAQLGLVINKGTKKNPGNRWANDGYPQPMSEVQFWQWLELQSDMGHLLLDYSALSAPPVS